MSTVIQKRAGDIRHWLACLCLASLCCLPVVASASITFQTRMEAVKWETESSKFSCRLSHEIDGFGIATFEREAGEQTRFYLSSKMPRMKTGKAALLVRPPAWSPTTQKPKQLALVGVKESVEPVVIDRQLAERMLAELQKGMLLDIKRQPWYGDQQSLQVTLSNIRFRQSHQEYLNCLSGLLPVNFKQVERSSFNYDNEDEDLTDAVKRRLDTVIGYAKEDTEVQAFYIDGHTDSEGIRNENLLKSKLRAERVKNYLIGNGITEDKIAMRWHGERYKLVSNRTAKGRAENRRVTLRLSQSPPVVTIVEPQVQQEQTTAVTEESETQEAEAQETEAQEVDPQKTEDPVEDQEIEA